MHRWYLTVENGIAGIFACGGVVGAIAVRDIGLRVCFSVLGALALFYLILSFRDIRKTICRQCGRRIWDKRNGDSGAKRIDTLDDFGDLIRITVICPQCGNEKCVWEKKKRL